MEPKRFLLKDQLFNRDKLSALASEIERVHPEFRGPEFVAEAGDGLPELELKERISWISACLEKYLPKDFREAVSVILRSLPAPNDPALSDGDFGDFIYAPYADYVARRGCVRGDLDFSLVALRQITMRFSVEDAIRTFINTFPDETLHTLESWASDSHYHVRRLCSEGTRPKLPWARKLVTPHDAAIPILDKLFADRTRFVTRSVANHLNDISKIDPDLAIDTLRRWQQSGRQTHQEMGYIVRHATRTLVKSGHPRALELLGIPHQPRLHISQLTVPRRVELGSALEFSFVIQAREDAGILADYVIHFVGNAGKLTGRKVFRLKRLSLVRGQQVTLIKRHVMRGDMTTRRIHPGRHELEILINGRPYGRRAFWITPPGL